MIATVPAIAALAAVTIVPAWPLAAHAVPLRVALVTIVRPDDDPTLVADAFLGLQRARSDFAGQVTTAWLPLRARSSDARAVREEHSSMLGALHRAAQSSDLVIAWGDLLTDAAVAVALGYPRVRFILEDAPDLKKIPPNVIDSTIWDGEQAFLAGATAAMYTRSGRIGYLGPVPGWQDNAFRAGAYYVNPRVRTIVDYVTTTTTAVGGSADIPASWRTGAGAGTSEPGYHDARKAEEVALAQFDLGADIISITGAASDAGAYRAALLRHRWVIGRGGPRSLNRMPEAWRSRNLAMIIKRGDVVVYQLVNRVLNGPPLLQHSQWRFRYPVLPVPVIGVTLDNRAPPLTANAGGELNRIMDDLRDGRIEVPYSKEGLAVFIKHHAR